MIGSSRALDLILHAQLVSPKEAFDLGIINKLVSEASFNQELISYCEDLSNRAPIALLQHQQSDSLPKLTSGCI